MSQTETPQKQNRRQIVRPYAELGASLIPGEAPETSEISDDELEYLSRMGRSYSRYSQHDSLEEMIISYVGSHDDPVDIEDVVDYCSDPPVVGREDVRDVIDGIEMRLNPVLRSTDDDTLYTG